MSTDDNGNPEMEKQGGAAKGRADEGHDGLDDPSRRSFFTRAAVGGGAALLAGGATYAATQASLQGVPSEGPQTDETFKPMDQRNMVLTFATSVGLNEQHNDRNEQYSRLQNKDFHFNKAAQQFEHRLPHDNNKPGYTQLDRALHWGAWALLDKGESKSMKWGAPNQLLFQWDQSDKSEEQYQFKSKEEAATAIKSAARVYGSVRCGIAKRDKRWDYDPIYDSNTDTEYSWEEDFPFEPKSVIVMLTPMDYDCIATAPAWTAEGTVGDGYSSMAKIACQMARFIRGLGYNAVASGNDLGMSVAYGIMAGLGEGGRNAQLLAPGVGSRVRICKVYTDFDFVEYDGPHDWGIAEFCKSCGKCAEACPPGALPKPEDPNGGWGFHPAYEFSDEEGYTWSNHTGVEKFYTDSKKCFNFWIENDSACGACIAACTFNEADYWHHWFIMGITPYSPEFLHSWMAELHPVFGYGSTADPAKVEKFWKTGEGMRVNPLMKNNIGTSNNS